MKKGVQYFVNYVTDGAPYYHFIIGGMWIVTAFLVILQLLLGLGYKNDIFMMFGLHRGTSAMVISCQPFTTISAFGSSISKKESPGGAFCSIGIIAFTL